jgi:hypothetical protein
MTIIISTLLSQPLDVCFVKMASQRSLHYQNPIQTIAQIWKEEGPSKLFFGGLWPRLFYYMASTLALVQAYPYVLNAST